MRAWNGYSPPLVGGMEVLAWLLLRWLVEAVPSIGDCWLLK